MTLGGDWLFTRQVVVVIQYWRRGENSAFCCPALEIPFFCDRAPEPSWPPRRHLIGVRDINVTFLSSPIHLHPSYVPKSLYTTACIIKERQGIIFQQQLRVGFRYLGSSLSSITLHSLLIVVLTVARHDND